MTNEKTMSKWKMDGIEGRWNVDKKRRRKQNTANKIDKNWRIEIRIAQKLTIQREGKYKKN